jgi:hypothetical protein
MNAIIDLGSELLFDISSISNPYLRLAMTAVGQSLVGGSSWIAVNRRDAALWGLCTPGVTERAHPPASATPAVPRRGRRPARGGRGWSVAGQRRRRG